MKNFIYELHSPFKLQKLEFNYKANGLKSDQIYAETKYTALSVGTELAAWVGKKSLRPGSTYPRLIGYCNLAKVIELGPSVTNISVGDYILTHQSHRSAFICKSNEILLQTTEQNDEIHKKLTALYLYHLGYTALIAGDFRPGHQVAIIGMGTLGVTTATLLKIFGATPIIFTNQHVDNVWCQKMGFSYIFSKDMTTPPFIKESYDLDGFDIVINTSDRWSDFILCQQIARKGGNIVCLGFPGREEGPPEINPLDSQYFYDKQLCIKHCGYTPDIDVDAIAVRFSLKRNMKYLASLVFENKINPLDIISFEVSSEKLSETYELISSRNERRYSALIRWKA